MKTNEMLPFKGMICIDIPMTDGLLLSLLKWDSTPTAYDAFSQVWITDNDGRKTCYIDPGEAEELFRRYHAFDEVVPSKISWRWENVDHLDITVHNKDITISIVTLQPLPVQLVNLILKTPAKALFRKAGHTETGMSYCHQSERIGIIKSARIDFGQGSTARLGENANSALSWGTHYLEDWQRNRDRTIA